MMGEALFLFCWAKVLGPTIFGSDNLKLLVLELLLALLSEQLLAHLLGLHFWAPKTVGVTFGPFVGPTNGPKVPPTEGPKFIPTPTFLQCREPKTVGPTIFSQQFGEKVYWMMAPLHQVHAVGSSVLHNVVQTLKVYTKSIPFNTLAWLSVKNSHPSMLIQLL